MSPTNASAPSVVQGTAPEATLAAGAVNAALKAAWMAVLLGLSVQVLILLARLLAGGKVPALSFLASIGQGISWSVLVCGGVAIGTAALKGRTAIMGLLGLVSGPIAWGVAKGAQKGIQALAGIPQDQMTMLFYIVTALRGIEYAVLGATLGYIVGKPWAKLPVHFGIGALIGALAAATIVPLSVARSAAAGAPMPMPAIAGTLTGELTFPIGCSLVIYFVRHVRSKAEQLVAATRAPA